jgi:aminoethylphosphonate catabolism LysR family transcriptional regulator
MNDAQLRCFHAAAIEQNVTRAAARLGISQPTVSAQIKALEEGYGVQLFRRTAGRIELTDFGRQLKAITEQIYSAQDAARDLLLHNRSVSGGHLRIGTVAAFHVLPILAVLRERFPEVTFSLGTGNSATIFAKLSRYEFDIAVAANIRAGDARFHEQFLRRDEIVIYLRKDHALASGPAISYADLVGERLIIREKGSVTRDVFLAAMATAEVGEARMIEIESREAIKEAVAYGFGIAPVLRSEVGHDDRCVALPITPQAPVFDEFVVCSRDLIRSPLVKAFLEAAQAFATKLEDPVPPPRAVSRAGRRTGSRVAAGSRVAMVVPG